MSVVVSLQSKVCSKCKEVKTLDGFGKRKASKDGYSSECKACKLDVDIKYRAENPEKRKESCAKYRAANPEKIKKRSAKWYAANPDYHAEWRAANPEKIKERKAKYYVANTQKIKDSQAKYCASNPEKVKERKAKYYAANVEKIKEYDAKYKKLHPEKCRAYKAKRRAAKLLAIPFWLTEDDYKAIEAIYAEVKRLEAETGLVYHVDHIHPLQGKLVCGFHCPSNFQILTKSENCSKGNKFKPYVESDLIS